MAIVNIGIDPAQRIDFCAIVVCEVEQRDGDDFYIGRHVEKLQQGTPYPQQVERVKKIYNQMRTDGHDIKTFLDCTGVGLPVSDMFKQAGIAHTMVFFTNGHQETHEGNELHLPKNLMVSRLQVLLQQQRILLPDSAQARELSEELDNYEIKVNENANLQMGVFKLNKHDDLATALGLATRPLPTPSASRGYAVGLYKDKRAIPRRRWER